MKEAIKEGFKFDGKENKISLEQFSKATGKGTHANHPKYNTNFKEKLSQNSKLTGEEALNYIRNLVKETKKNIESNPDTKINDLYQSTAPLLNPITMPKDNTNVINNFH